MPGGMINQSNINDRSISHDSYMVNHNGSMASMPYLKPLYLENEQSPDLIHDYLKSVPAKMYDKSKLNCKPFARSNASPVEPSSSHKHLEITLPMPRI